MSDIPTTEDNIILSVPSIAYGFDIQNYGDESQLIYMLDIEDLDPNNKTDEAMVTKSLGKGPFKISVIMKSKFETILEIVPMSTTEGRNTAYQILIKNCPGLDDLFADEITKKFRGSVLDAMEHYAITKNENLRACLIDVLRFYGGKLTDDMADRIISLTRKP